MTRLSQLTGRELLNLANAASAQVDVARKVMDERPEVDWQDRGYTCLAEHRFAVICRDRNGLWAETADSDLDVAQEHLNALQGKYAIEEVIDLDTGMPYDQGEIVVASHVFADSFRMTVTVHDQTATGEPQPLTD